MQLKEALKAKAKSETERLFAILPKTSVLGKRVIPLSQESLEALLLNAMVDGAAIVVQQTIKSDCELPNRNTVYSVEVDGKHWRWAGTYEQFEKDVHEYCNASEGIFTLVSRGHIVYKEKLGFNREHTIVFKAIKQ